MPRRAKIIGLNGLVIITLLIHLTGRTAAQTSTPSPFAPTQLADIAATLGEALHGKGNPAETPLAIVANSLTPFWTAGQIGSQIAASELGVPVLFTAPIKPGDNVGQQKIIDSLITEGYKAIAISVIDPVFIQPELQMVSDKNIPFIAIDSDAPNTHRLLYMGTDNYQAGVLAGKALLRELGSSGGKVIGLVGETTAPNAIDRIQGIKDTLAGSNVVLEDVLVDDLDPLKAVTNAMSALDQEPDLAAFVTLYSYDAGAAGQALGLANKLGQVKVIAFDLEPETIDLLKQGVVSEAIVQRPYYMGYLSVYILDAVVTLGVDKTMTLLAPYLSGPNNDIIDTGVDIISADTLPAYSEYLNSIGIKSQ